jgi:putative transposase
MSLFPYPTPDPPARKLLRLQNHGYSHPGPYFITICTHQKKCTLGYASGAAIQPTKAGQIARATWQSLPERFRGLVLDAFVVMPNHVHGVLALVGAGLAPPGVNTTTMPTAEHSGEYSLPDVIGAFKSISTIQVNRFLSRRGWPLWHRSYYEHIIRDGEDMKNVQRYILENPWNWSLDPENPEATKRDRSSLSPGPG